MHYKDLDDQKLIALVAQEDADALDALYNRYKRLVYSLVFNMVQDGATAEELMLEVFVRIWEKAHTYHPDKALVRTWLMSIARHRTINWLRQQKNRPETNSLSWGEVPSTQLPSVHSPEDIAETHLLRQRVRDAVTQLPVEQQEALHLAYFGGYSHQQIANKLEQPLGTVKTRIRLAMQKLRHLLEGETM